MWLTIRLCLPNLAISDGTGNLPWSENSSARDDDPYKTYWVLAQGTTPRRRKSFEPWCESNPRPLDWMYRCFGEWVTKLSRKQGIFTPELILSSFHFTPQLILSNIIPEGGRVEGRWSYHRIPKKLWISMPTPPLTSDFRQNVGLGVG